MIPGIPLNIDFSVEKFDISHYFDYYIRQSLHFCESNLAYAQVHHAQIKQLNPATTKDKLIVKEKQFIVDSFIDDMESSILDFQGLNLVSKFLQLIENDGYRARLKLNEIILENIWLRSIIFDISKKINKIEESVQLAENDRKVYHYFYKMRVPAAALIMETTTVVKLNEDEISEPDDIIPNSIIPINNLSIEYLQQQREDLLVTILEDNINKFKTQTGANSLEVAALYTIMAKVMDFKQQLSDAQGYLNKALNIRENKLGKTHDAVGVTLTKLSLIQLKRKQYKDAETNANIALSIRSKFKIKTDLCIGLLEAEMGLIKYNLGKYADCVTHYKSALTVLEFHYEASDVFLLRCYLHLSQAYVKIKQCEKATPLLEKLCYEFQMKNVTLPQSENPETVFQFLNSQQGDSNYSPSSCAYTLTKRYGRCEQVLDKVIYELFMEYFSTINKRDVVNCLTSWVNIETQQKEVVRRRSFMAERPSIKEKNMKKLESLYGNGNKPKQSTLSAFTEKATRRLSFLGKPGSRKNSESSDDAE